MPPSVIPSSLRTAVNTGGLRQQYQLTSIPGNGGAGTPAIAVGSIIDIPLSGPFELYFVYPLNREQQILDLVQSAIERVYAEGKTLTRDVGGKSGTGEFKDAVLAAMESEVRA